MEGGRTLSAVLARSVHTCMSSCLAVLYVDACDDATCLSCVCLWLAHAG